MEISAFLHGELPSKAALGRAMMGLGFLLSITSTDDSLDRQKGFLPMRLDGKESGVEFDVLNSRADIEDIANGLEIDPCFERPANFRWGGDEGGMLGAICAAAALAQLAQGVVLGEYDEEPLSAEQAIAAAREHLEGVLKPKPKPKD